MDRLTSPPPFLEVIESLKALKHSTWASNSVPESDSLSEHIYQMALVCLAHPDLHGEDEMRAIAMCLTHDLSNIASGEVTLLSERHEKGELEEQLGLEYLVSILRERCPTMAERLPEAQIEYKAHETRAAKLVYQIHTFESLRHAAICRKKGRKTIDDKKFETIKEEITDAWLAKETEQILSDEWDPLEQMVDPRAPIIFVIGDDVMSNEKYCEQIAKEFNMKMVSVDRLLRDEQTRPGSIFGDFLKESLENSAMAPPSLTTMLLKRKIKEIQSMGKGVLIEGFPQSITQAVAFEREISNVYSTIYFVEPLSISGIAYSDDGSAAEGFRRAKRTTREVVEYMSKNSFKTIHMEKSQSEVNSMLQNIVKEILERG